jgi:hypothetical protein
MTVRDRGIARSAGLAGLLGLSMLLASCQQPKGEPGTPGAAPGGTSGTKPKLEIIGGETIDWGKQPPGTLKRTLMLVNSGGDTLRIADVHPSCGCTTAPLDKKVLGAGDTAHVDVSIDMTNRSGPQHKTITITSNDSTRPTVQVSLTADIVRDVVANPEVFPIINSAVAGHEDTTAVTIINKSTGPIEIQAPLVSNPGQMAVTFNVNTARTLAPGDSVRIVAHVKPLTASVVTADVTINTSSKTVPVVKVPITANASPKTSANSAPIVPEKVTVGGGKSSGSATPGKTPAAKSPRQ